MPERRPNIVLITTDRQRFDCLGLNGNPALQTPNLDALGAAGANFANAYSEVPSCIPARRILVTGMNQESTGLVGYREGLEWEPPHTLGRQMSLAGYQTELVGKLHLWPHRKRYGFDHFVYGDDLGERAENDYSAYLRRQGLTEPRPWMGHGCEANSWIARPWHLDERLTHTYWCGTEALNFLETRDPSQPFFLYVSFLHPHMPLTPPAHYFDRYLAKELPPPVHGDWAQPVEPGPGQPLTGSVHLSEEQAHQARAGYYGLINAIDDQVGRIRNALVRMNLHRDTFYLFTSDHGEMLGDHDQWGIRHPYQAVTHIPMLANGPSWMGLQSRAVIDQPIGLQDIAPTIMDIAGAEIPDTVDGRSFLPLLRGESVDWRSHLHLEHNDPRGAAGVGHQTLTDGRRKYIWFPATGREQFFDLTTDPAELRDLAAERTDEVAAWREKMIDTLRDRPEGFVADGRLVPGRPYGEVLAEATG